MPVWDWEELEGKRGRKIILKTKKEKQTRKRERTGNSEQEKKERETKKEKRNLKKGEKMANKE